MVVSHMPFTARHLPPFNIDEDIYTEWAKILREKFHPDIMLCGHEHNEFQFNQVGSEKDNFGQPCTVVVASHCVRGEAGHLGCGIEFSPEGIFITPTESVFGISETLKI